MRFLFLDRKHKLMVAQVLNELTKLPRRGRKTDVYHRGMIDGVKLVRQRAKLKGINLDNIDEPVATVRVLEIE